MLPKLAFHTQMRMTITPQMVLAHDVLRLSGDDLRAAITRELERNPALTAREAPPARAHPKSRLRSHSHTTAPIDSNNDDDDGVERAVARESALDRLAADIRLMVTDPRDLDVATRLVYALDGQGYLRASAVLLAWEMGVDRARVDRAIGVLRQLHPAGIGARDLRDCFQLQCADLAARGVDCGLAPRLLEHDQAWAEFAAQRWDRAARALGVRRQDIDHVLSFIRANLYPFPLALVPDDRDAAPVLTPDVVVRRPPDGSAGFTVEIPAAQRYGLVINDTFARAVRDTSAEDSLTPAQRDWVCQSVDQARAFMDALDQRWATLRRIAEYLVSHQADFFAHGARHLQPVTRADVARALNLHESTVSRAVSDKAVQLPDGQLMALGDLFDGSQAAKAAMRDLMAQTSHALTDREIARRLGMAGISLARRTVAKYREQLGIPARKAHAARPPAENALAG